VTRVLDFEVMEDTANERWLVTIAWTVGGRLYVVQQELDLPLAERAVRLWQEACELARIGHRKGLPSAARDITLGGDSH
jgi:hypothetical protein